jgi:hypothetical protein
LRKRELTRGEFQAKQLKLLEDLVIELRKISERLQTQTINPPHSDVNMSNADPNEEELDDYE